MKIKLIKLTSKCDKVDKDIYINANLINSIKREFDYTYLCFESNSEAVIETPEEIIKLMNEEQVEPEEDPNIELTINNHTINRR